MPRSFFISLLISMLTCLSGCDSWVDNIEAPETVILDDQLTSEDQVDLLINGVIREFSRTHSYVAVYSGELADESYFNPGFLSPYLEEIDDAQISFSNVFVDNLYWRLGSLRFLADDLIRRSGEIAFKDGELRQRAAFTGYLYGAIARYDQAAYYGLSEQVGGGVITTEPSNPGPFIPSEQMYELALEKLDSAATNAAPDEARIANTISARIYLILDRRQSARIAAESGMRPGDPDFQALHIPRMSNQLLTFRRALPVDSTYETYVDADPSEALRLQLVRDSIQVARNGGAWFRYYIQNRYSDRSDPARFCTWQENELILAELDLDDGDTSGSLMHVNAVRADYGLDPLTSIDRKILEVERRKELWMMGLRLIDQRRFGSWHKGDDTWQYLPIPQSERDRNPNL